MIRIMTLFVTSIAFAATGILHLCILRLFPRWNLLDFPQRYGLSRRRLPYPAGIAAVIVFCVIFPFLASWSLKTAGILGAIVLLAACSFLDDRRPLPPITRLATHLAVAAVIYGTGRCTGGRICSLTNPLSAWSGSAIIELNGRWPILGLIVTMAWIILTINALNWFDGIPGQVSTLSIIGFLTIGFLALLRLGQADVALIAFTLATIAFGSFLFEFPVPRVVAGDTGTMFFGLMLGILTIYAGGKVATAFLVLGFPIIDSFIVITRRLLRGVSPLRGNDGEHLHHRLLAIGWSPTGVIALSACIGAVFGITALFVGTRGKVLAALLLLFFMLGLSWYCDKHRTRNRR